MRKVHEWFSSAEIRFAVVCSLLLGALLCISMFSGARPGAIDYGEYDAVLQAAGLKRTQWDMEHPEERYYVKPTERFDYAPFSYAELMARPTAPSIVYPIALVRLVTQPLGLEFSTHYLFFLYVFVLMVSAFQILRYCYVRMRLCALVPAALMLIAFSNRTLLGYLNSLYAPGMAITMFMAYLACASRAALQGGRASGLASALIGFLLVNAQPELIVLLPTVVVTSSAIMVRNRTRRAGYALLCVLVLLLGVRASITQFTKSSDYSADASSYHATFLGLLKYSPDVRADVAELGLDESYLADVGRSYYEADDAYVHNPRDSQEADALFAKIGPAQRLSFYLRNPSRMISGLIGVSTSFSSYDSSRVVAAPCIAATLLDMLIPDGLLPASVALMAVLIVSLVVLIVRARRGGSILALFLPMWAMGALAYPAIRMLLCGDANIELAKVTHTFFVYCAFAIAVSAVVHSANRLFSWMEGKTLPAEPAFQVMSHSFIGRALFGVAGSRRRTTVAVLLVGVMMAGYLLFIPPRAGGVNNGDFGRMMDQLDLFWTEEIDANVSHQAGRGVIETYTFRRAFDPLKLTAFKPVYSLIYLAALVRLICETTGQLFHTNYLSYVFAVAALLCLLRLTMDLHVHFGRWTLAVGLTLAAMLFGEVYFAWFNSLFGEGSVYLGILMTLTCAVWLAVLPRGKGARLVFLLGFAVRFLVTAKAQMAVALPVGIFLIAAYAIYHRPKQMRKALVYGMLVTLMCALISMATIGVYRENDRISSRQTVWQSVFFGLLMTADDPEAAMEELGIDPRMAPDIGKHAYLPDDAYVFAPMSEEARTAFYDRVNAFTVARYYFRHPGQLIEMLDRAATQSVTLHDGFMAYVGQRYDEAHDAVNRLGLWQFIRPMLAARTAWQYAVLYLLAGAWWIWRALRRKADGRSRMMALTMLSLLAIAVLQFPLTVIGNGFADNNKQLFAFMLCHDLIVIIFGYEVLSRLLWWLEARRYIAKSENAVE